MPANQIRLIGGTHRGRRLHFVPAAGLRPTADRVRETLFNWLQGEVQGRRCLDLFAGSGALGLEALSRGAAQLTLVEQARAVARQLLHNVELLSETARCTVRQGDAFRLLAGPAAEVSGAPFDLVFIDPPFRDQRLSQLLDALARPGWLAPTAWVYIEQDSARDWPALPADWRLERETRAGQATGRLCRRYPPLPTDGASGSIGRQV